MMNPISKKLKALRSFGIKRLWYYGTYTLKVKSGFFQKRSIPKNSKNNKKTVAFSPLPNGRKDEILPFLLTDSKSILESAGEIITVGYRPYSGNIIRSLDLVPPHKDLFWTRIPPRENLDIKDIWEPARFCWVTALCRAYVLTGDRIYPEFFYRQVQTFIESNPPYYGENWVSAQEAAIRMISVTFAAGILQPSLPDKNSTFPDLPAFITLHATRIMQTRSYAKAQNNNHRLSEAAGLMTAACVLPKSPDASKWFSIGWKDFQNALNSQILPDGAYIQYSVNYHRLMLQLVLWVDSLLKTQKIAWPANLIRKIRRSVLWLAKHTDEFSGQACNTGHNDGSLLFALGGNYNDFRPTLQTAAIVFLGKPLFPPGPWDEMRIWLGCYNRAGVDPDSQFESTFYSQNVQRISAGNQWGILHTAGFKDRPAHADQLHVSLWKGGKCMALDAGTYRYTAAPPWDNRLKSAFVHNCLTIDCQEPMIDAGKFLWLDWDQARILDQTEFRKIAEHSGYKRLGLKHSRILEKTRQDWLAVDKVLPIRVPNSPRAPNTLFHGNLSEKKHLFRLHWLLPEQKFEVLKENNHWCFLSKDVKIIFSANTIQLNLIIIRAGQQIFPTDSSAENSDPFRDICGWYSPTYGIHIPALSLILTAETAAPFVICSRWKFLPPGL